MANDKIEALRQRYGTDYAEALAAVEELEQQMVDGWAAEKALPGALKLANGIGRLLGIEARPRLRQARAKHAAEPTDNPAETASQDAEDESAWDNTADDASEE